MSPLLIGILILGNKLYIYIFSLVPILKAYSSLRDVEVANDFSFLIPSISILLIQITSVSSYSKFIIKHKYFPIKLFSLRSINTFNIFLIIFTLITISLEMFAPSIYSIGRIKSDIYPSLFLTITLLGYVKKRYTLFTCTLISSFFSISIFYNFFERISFTF